MTVVYDAPRAYALDPLELEELIRARAAAIILDPLKDKAYQALGPGTAVAEYLAWKRLTAAASTLVRYEGVLARLCVCYPDQQLEDFDSGQLLAYIQQRPEKSWRYVTVVLRDFFRWARIWKEATLPANPMDLITTPKQQSVRVYDIFSPSEQASLLAACQGYEMAKRDRVGVLLFLDTGARKSDVRLLQWRDVDLIDNFAIYRHRKGDREQIVDFGERVQRALIDLYHSPVPLWDQPLGPNDYVLFPARHNAHVLTKVYPFRPMAESTAHRWWYKRLMAAEIVDLGENSGRRLHLTRHTHGTEAYEATGDLEAVRERLGHQNITTTQVYVHQSRRRKRATLAALETYRDALQKMSEDLQ